MPWNRVEKMLNVLDTGPDSSQQTVVLGHGTGLLDDRRTGIVRMNKPTAASSGSDHDNCDYSTRNLMEKGVDVVALSAVIKELNRLTVELGKPCDLARKTERRLGDRLVWLGYVEQYSRWTLLNLKKSTAEQSEPIRRQIKSLEMRAREDVEAVCERMKEVDEYQHRLASAFG
eukprot:TRINITY_DN5852_c0_g1_i1.p1 TRINITY_DN5852_c0_g1~~TRINITY_DN5852_c0_g1_i1.p1  ORF type:complete len:173 (-),score=16.67 TRINITY_DN5852_c0_g1_i1:15-533(-)